MIVADRTSEIEFMLTTKDNPFDPFTQFDEWNAYDELLGYYTTAYIGRVVNVADSMSEEDKEFDYIQAIADIVDYDFTGMYEIVSRSV